MRTHADRRDQAGVVTAFTVVMTVALLAVTGLVVDGGLVLADRQRAFDTADAAARAGAQALDERALRSGTVTINPGAATRRAAGLLAREGMTGTTSVNGDQVTVRTTLTRNLTILGAFGVQPLTIHATGTATAIRGVRTGGD